MKIPAMLLAFAALAATPAIAADPAKIDWSKVPASAVTLFYPAQSTYQWLRSPDHPGAAPVSAGEACVTCHKGQETQKGNALGKANKLEPTPADGKNGAVQLGFQVAYDNENAYFRFQWKTRAPHPGEAYPALRF